MIDLEKHIVYWRDSAQKDIKFASRTIDRDKEVQYGLFFVHLALEKALKALVCKHTKDLPPRIHNLIRLAELGDVKLSPDQIDFFGKINIYNIEGRYPDMVFPTLSLDIAKIYLKKSEEQIEWLINLL